MRSYRKTRTMLLAAVTGAALWLTPLAAQADAIKNVILMISDGQGFNTVKATEYYKGAKAVYEGSDFVRYAMQTNSANNPAGYSPASMASSFNYSKTGATDSASAATAMYTGIKNYDGTVNWTTDGKPLTTFFEKAALAGKSIGAVSSVEYSHATPAALYGHNSSRNNYAAIAYEGTYGSNPLNGSVANSGSNPKAGNNGNYDSLNYNGNLKVLMGAGHPGFNDNGQPASKTANYVGGTTTWTDMTDGSVPNGWTLIQDKADFEAVANGTLNPGKLLGVAQVNTTLQQARTSGSPLNTNVPTLETMTKAALNVLDNNSQGFAVMIEGGAVDWANHANQLNRMIEEQIDFNNSVQAVVDYLNAGTNGNNWNNTLLMVTADHETGHLWGNGTGTFFDVNGNGVFDAGVDYAHVVNNGQGNLPGAQYFSGDHTNALVPLFVKGAGSELFADQIAGTESNLRALYNLDDSWTGQYVDNTAVYRVMRTSVPEPGIIMYLLGSAAFGLVVRRRQAGN